MTVYSNYNNAYSEYTSVTATDAEQLNAPHARAARIASLGLLRTPHTPRRIALAVLLLLGLVILGLIFIPWQQSVTGNGRVMILSPMQRPQNIEAQIPGRLLRWAVSTLR